MVTGIAHTALYTPCFEDTIRFYQEVFGASVLGYFQTDRRACWLQLGQDILELFESEALPDGCFRHIAVACSDTEALFDRALRHGALPLVEPKRIVLPLADPVPATIAFFRGIAGEQVELFAEG